MALPAITDEARLQLQLPVREGGFGLSSVQAVSPSAWYSAFANSFNRIRPLFDTLDTLTPDIPFVKSLSQCIKYFKTFKFPPRSPASSTIAQFWSNYENKRCGAGTQRQIMSIIYKARSKALLNKFPRNSPDRARLTSISIPYSGSWLITPPLNPLLPSMISTSPFPLASV
jgi:hypothetical protein